MNQVDVASASRYLGNLGASITATSTTTVYTEGSTMVVKVPIRLHLLISPAHIVPDLAPSWLDGHHGFAVEHYYTCGRPKLISVAEGYLKQIDLRKRQVAVKVQILNVNLDNKNTFDSSFSAKIGDTFIVNESGNAHMNFGAYKPGSSAGGIARIRALDIRLQVCISVTWI